VLKVRIRNSTSFCYQRKSAALYEKVSAYLLMSVELVDHRLLVISLHASTTYVAFAGREIAQPDISHINVTISLKITSMKCAWDTFSPSPPRSVQGQSASRNGNLFHARSIEQWDSELCCMGFLISWGCREGEEECDCPRHHQVLAHSYRWSSDYARRWGFQIYHGYESP